VTRTLQRAILSAVGLGLGLAAAPALAATGADADAPASPARFMLLLALMVGAAKLGGVLAERVGQPAVLGELAASVLVGPSVLGAISSLHVDPGSHIFHLLAEVGVVLLLFEIGLETGLALGKLALSVGFLAVAIVAGRRLAPRALDVIKALEMPGLLVTGARCFMLLLTFCATLAGTALIIGGFAAGLVPAETRQSEEIERAMAPVVDVFAPAFFVLVGAAVDVSYLNPFVAANRPTLLLTGVLLCVAVIGKLASGIGVRHPGASRLVVGVGMVPRGEVGLIFAQSCNQIVVNRGGVPERRRAPGLYAAVTLTVMLTTHISPPALRAAFARQEGTT
jgi:Kef-type K+ transport system membrane component KefB